MTCSDLTSSHLSAAGLMCLGLFHHIHQESAMILAAGCATSQALGEDAIYGVQGNSLIVCSRGRGIVTPLKPDI